MRTTFRAYSARPLAVFVQALLTVTPFATLPLACSASEAEPSSSSVDEIVGGTLDTGHPYAVMAGDGVNPPCSGTLISSRTVLTAAHCEEIGITTVEFGTQMGDATNVRIPVTRQVRHPGFGRVAGGKLVNDLLVLQLASAAPVAPAPLLRAPLTNDASFVGPAWTFVGFGLTKAQGNDYGTKHQLVQPVTAVGPTTAPDGMKVEASLVYHGTPGRGICSGDSGGPAFVVRDGVEMQAGVNSVGRKSCMGGGFEQKVDRDVLQSFLQAVIDDFEGRDACRSDGVCTESCNVGGRVLDPDCAAAHCGSDGLCATACVAPVDPDCSNTPPPPPPPATDLFCPAGFTYEAASRLCTSATEAVGPFSPAMVAQCLKFGGDDGCAKDTWAAFFARELRGTDPCPLGTTLDARKGYCAEGDNLYGPFTKAEVDVCVANGGGPGCTTTVRWHRSFIADRF